MGHQNLICSKNQELDLGFVSSRWRCSTNIGAIGSLVLAILAYIRALFVPRHRLALEAAALRQQLAVSNGSSLDPDSTAKTGSSRLGCVWVVKINADLESAS